MHLSVNVVDHPLVHHHLSRLRSVETGPERFRHCVRHLSSLLAMEATRSLPTESCSVETPLCTTSGRRLQSQVALVPILRAGLGMVDPVLDLIPDAHVWHLGMYRNEATAQPVEYYNKLPSNHSNEYAFVLDPMLATGGSAASACQALVHNGMKRIKLLSLIAAPEGVGLLNQEFPELEIFVCALDERLNEQKFIVPGLGDAGDRIFNTLDPDQS